ncbi:ribose 5-phosphate isomerase B [Mycoplasmatota bacterium]|nr:ribose 5-phosphate isomerase B [Mycoplasmatota bacterium]
MKIAIGCDHGGYELKEKIKKYISEELHMEYDDLGTYNKERCDYPDYAFLVSHAVATKKCDFGIMIDGAGIGSSMMANKVPGVLAACANEIYTARNSRHHNGANVLTLGSMVVGEGVAKEIVKIFLTTKFEGERNIKRINSILDIEKRLLDCRRR